MILPSELRTIAGRASKTPRFFSLLVATMVQYTFVDIQSSWDSKRESVGH